MQAKEMRYAGFWIRFAATVIDTVLLLLVTLPLLIAIYGWAYLDAKKTGFVAGGADILITWVLPAVAVIAFWIAKQATPGKMLLSARIMDASTGNAPSAGQLIGRYFAYLVSLVPFGLGYLWIAFDKRKQGWHDKLAGTVVVRTGG